MHGAVAADKRLVGEDEALLAIGNRQIRCGVKAVDQAGAVALIGRADVAAFEVVVDAGLDYVVGGDLVGEDWSGQEEDRGNN